MANDQSRCPGDEKLAGFIDGTLEGDERALVEAHVASCAECSAALAAWDAEASPIVPSEAFREQFEDMRPAPRKASTRSSARRYRSPRPVRLVWGFSVAAAAVVVGALLLHYSTGDASVPAGDRPRHAEADPSPVPEAPPRRDAADTDEGDSRVAAVDDPETPSPADDGALPVVDPVDDEPQRPEHLEPREMASKPERTEPAAPSFDTAHIAYLDAVEGAVEMRTERAEPWRAAPMGAGLSTAAGLRTKLSRARVVFESGTTLYVNRFTTLGFARRDGVPGLVLVGGEVYVETVERDVGFHVDTEQGRAVDLGTKFGVKTAMSRTTVVVVEGAVRASTDAGEVDLADDQETLLVRKTSRPTPARRANNLEQRLAWKNGLAPRPEEDDDSLAVISFTLINADTNAPMEGFDPLRNGATIDLASLPTRNLNIDTKVRGEPGSVRFEYGGRALARASLNPMEGRGPFAVAGGLPGDYGSFTPDTGDLIVRATPFPEGNAKGEAGRALTIRLKIVDSARPKR